MKYLVITLVCNIFVTLQSIKTGQSTNVMKRGTLIKAEGSKPQSVMTLLDLLKSSVQNLVLEIMVR